MVPPHINTGKHTQDMIHFHFLLQCQHISLHTVIPQTLKGEFTDHLSYLVSSPLVYFQVSNPRSLTVPGNWTTGLEQFQDEWLPQCLVSGTWGIIPSYLINPQFPSQGRELKCTHNSEALPSRQLHCHKFSAAAFASLAVIIYSIRHP